MGNTWRAVQGRDSKGTYEDPAIGTMHGQRHRIYCVSVISISHYITPVSMSCSVFFPFDSPL